MNARTWNILHNTSGRGAPWESNRKDLEWRQSPSKLAGQSAQQPRCNIKVCPARRAKKPRSSPGGISGNTEVFLPSLEFLARPVTSTPLFTASTRHVGGCRTRGRFSEPRDAGRGCGERCRACTCCARTGPGERSQIGQAPAPDGAVWSSAGSG